MPKGIYIRTKEHNKSNSLSKKGKKTSEETRLKISKANKGKKHSEEAKQRMREAKLGKKATNETKEKMSKSRIGKKRPEINGDKNGFWKGDKAGYFAMHNWVIRHKGKASDYKCKCGKQAENWSNKKHDYKRNLDDYVAMCCSCHTKYDIKYNNKFN